MLGYIKLFRDLRENPIWQEKPFSKGQAWIDMIMRCNHVCKQMGPQYQSIWVLRGQFLLSNVKLADAWGWDEKTVRRFMKYLEQQGMVMTSAHTKYTVYEVTKYADYQALEIEGLQPKRAEQKPNRSRTKAEQKPTNKKYKNNKNIEDIYIVLFEFWNSKKIIVHQKLTDKIKSKLLEALKTYSEEDLKTAITNYEIVLHESKYYWSYTWTLEEFLSRGIEKFRTDICFNNYLKEDKLQGQSVKPSNCGNFEQRQYDDESLYYDNLRGKQ